MSPKETKNIPGTAAGDARAIEHLKHAVAGGKYWYLALLEAIKLWKSPEEDYQGRHRRYLIDGEAFDWLLLAERLTDEISQYIPEKERENLLFFDVPPVELGKEEFKKLIGPAKYRAYLNYLYGVLVEENLIAALVDEIRKETLASGPHKREEILDRAYRRIYGDTQQALLDKFRKEKKYRKRKSTNLSELKEFTYWLFKYRVKRSDKSRVASDTQKALMKMQRSLATRRATSENHD
jgi:hypothetical protein